MEDEVATLNCFTSFVILIDPGFNVYKFDLKYPIELVRKPWLNGKLCINYRACNPAA